MHDVHLFQHPIKDSHVVYAERVLVRFLNCNYMLAYQDEHMHNGMTNLRNSSWTFSATDGRLAPPWSWTRPPPNRTGNSERPMGPRLFPSPLHTLRKQCSFSLRWRPFRRHWFRHETRNSLAYSELLAVALALWHDFLPHSPWPWVQNPSCCRHSKKIIFCQKRLLLFDDWITITKSWARVIVFNI